MSDVELEEGEIADDSNDDDIDDFVNQNEPEDMVPGESSFPPDNSTGAVSGPTGQKKRRKVVRKVRRKIKVKKKVKKKKLAEGEEPVVNNDIGAGGGSIGGGCGPGGMGGGQSANLNQPVPLPFQTQSQPGPQLWEQQIIMLQELQRKQQQQQQLQQQQQQQQQQQPQQQLHQHQNQQLHHNQQQPQLLLQQHQLQHHHNHQQHQLQQQQQHTEILRAAATDEDLRFSPSHSPCRTQPIQATNVNNIITTTKPIKSNPTIISSATSASTTTTNTTTSCTPQQTPSSPDDDGKSSYEAISKMLSLLRNSANNANSDIDTEENSSNLRIADSDDEQPVDESTTASYGCDYALVPILVEGIDYTKYKLLSQYEPKFKNDPRLNQQT